MDTEFSITLWSINGAIVALALKEMVTTIKDEKLGNNKRKVLC